jgi:hypothetical protein
MTARTRRCGLCALLTSLALGWGRSEVVAQGSAGATLGPAQVISLAAARINILSVSVTSGSVQTIAALQDNAVNSFATPVVIATQWDVNPGQVNSISLVAYFTTPSQALVGGTVQIPSSRVLGRMSTGLPTTFTAFTQAAVAGAGTAGGSLRLFTENISGPNKGAITRTDNLDLQLDLVGFADLPVGTYTGTLNIRAVAQ